MGEAKTKELTVVLSPYSLGTSRFVSMVRPLCLGEFIDMLSLYNNLRVGFNTGCFNLILITYYILKLFKK